MREESQDEGPADGAAGTCLFCDEALTFRSLLGWQHVCTTGQHERGHIYRGECSCDAAADKTAPHCYVNDHGGPPWCRTWQDDHAAEDFETYMAWLTKRYEDLMGVVDQ